MSDAIPFLVEYRSRRRTVNYLDDYLFAAMLRHLCNMQVEAFLEICKTIGLPVSLEKTCWADTMVIFLGFLIDTVRRIVAVPRNKISNAINMIDCILDKESKPRLKRKMTVLQLQQICGFLNFLG